MRVFIIFNLLILVLLCRSSLCYTSFQNTYLLQDKMNSAPCAILKSSPPVLSGATIFSGLNIESTTSFPSLMITGWYILLGFSTQIYTLFSVHDNGIIAAISYCSDTQNYYIQLKSSTYQKFDDKMHFKEWVFLKFQVILSPTYPQNDQINFNVEKMDGNVISYTSPSRPNSIGDVMSFSNSMSINIGFSDSTLGLAPSCSFFKYVTLYLDDQPFVDSSISQVHSKKALNTYLLWHYDFSYSLANPQKLLSSGKDQDIITSYALSSTDPMKIRPNFEVVIKSFNALENNGFILYFETKITQQSTRVLVQICQEDITPFVIEYLGQQIRFTHETVTSNIASVNINQWYQLVLVVETIKFSIVKCMIKDLTSWIILPVTQQISSAYFVFGSSSQDHDFFFIEVYSGAFLSEDDSCLLYTARKEKNCLFCKGGYDLSYQNGMTCIAQDTPPTPTTKGNIQDWTHSCPLEQTYKGSPLSCSCRFGTYLSSSGCLSCPTYCKGCTDSIICLEKDLKRDTQTGKICFKQFYPFFNFKSQYFITLGNCDPLTFDDGYSCITRIYTIPHRKNIVQFSSLPFSTMCQYCIVFSQDLQLIGSQSFFLGFFVQYTDATNINSEQILAYIRDQGQDIFTISIKKVMNSQYFICFYNFLVELKCFGNSGQSIWIGLWIYQTQALLTVNNRGIFFQETSNNVLDRIYIDPSLCVGLCIQTTGLMLPSVSQGFSKSFPFTFILGMKSPFDGINDFFDLQQKPTELILSFNSINKVQSPTKYTCINQSTSSSYQGNNLEVSPPTVSKLLQGLLFTFGISAQLSQPIPGLLTNSLAMNIFIEQMTRDSVFIKFTLSGYLFKVYAILASSYDYVFIKICVVSTNINSCLQTQYASLTQGQPNFLGNYNSKWIHSRYLLAFDLNLTKAIIMRDLNPESTEFYLYEFEFVCNFKRERLIFTEIQSNLASHQGILLPQQQNMVFYLNNLKIFQGSDFYFEYSQDDDCFLYYDLSDMKCLKAKQGYALFNGLLVPAEDCINQISTTEAMIVYNKYTNECLQSTYVNPLCKEANDDLLSCKECVLNADLKDQQCKCNDGYFNPSGSTDCVVCPIKCSTCSGYDSCNSCYYSGASLPDCNCTNAEQYQDLKTFECKNCSNQCATCQGSPDDCTLCSTDRIDPPTCGCNPRYFNLALSNTQVCTLYDCSTKCDSCEYSISNCITCAPGRIDPPYCNCDIGYYEADTHCLSCPSHQFYDSSQKLCIECDIHCKECWSTSKTCTDCDSDLFLVDSTCLCSDLSSFTISASNEIICSSGMGVILSTEMRNSMYSLVFSFEEDLTLIDFDKNPIDTILFLYIQQVPEESYFIKEAFIEGNKLIAQLSFRQSFSASSGSATFLSSTQISSSSTQKNLDRKYLTTPLTFKIGPLLIADDQWQSSESLQGVSTFLKTADSNIIVFIRQFSIIFYVLNTLQPSVGFLMTKIVIPPNLYQSLQIIALMIFPNVQDYSVVETTYETSFLGFQLEKEVDITENESVAFKRFSLSNSMVVNIPIALLQFLIWPIVFCIITISSSIAFRSKSMPKSTKGITLALKQINSNNEMALLLISTACLNQFFNLNTSQYFNRISCFLSGIYIMVILVLHYHNYQHLISSGSLNNCIANKQKTTSNKNDNNQHESEIILILLENLDFQHRPRLITYFFYSQILKKYLLSIFLICFQNYPIISFSGCSFIFFASALLTAVIRPYKKPLDNLVKLVGETCLFSAWMIYLLKFVLFQRKLNESAIISSEDINEFLVYGSVIVYILIVYNSLYLILFIWRKVIVKIVEYLQQKKGEDQIQCQSPQTHFLQYNQAYVKSNVIK